MEVLTSNEIDKRKLMGVGKAMNLGRTRKVGGIGGWSCILNKHGCHLS